MLDSKYNTSGVWPLTIEWKQSVPLVSDSDTVTSQSEEDGMGPEASFFEVLQVQVLAVSVLEPRKLLIVRDTNAVYFLDIN